MSEVAFRRVHERKKPQYGHDALAHIARAVKSAQPTVPSGFWIWDQPEAAHGDGCRLMHTPKRVLSPTQPEGGE